MVVKCPKCNHFVSDMAPVCPHCGEKLFDDPQTVESDNGSEQTHDNSQLENSLGGSSLEEQRTHQVTIEQPVQTEEDVAQVESVAVRPQVETTSKIVPAEQNAPVKQVPNDTSSTYSAPVATPPSNVAYQEAKKSNSTLIGIIVLLAVIICGVGGYFYYDNVYLPEKIDREAPRYYSMANVIVLRSSRSAGADFNKVASLPYGTELITYEYDSEWAKVKVNSQAGEKQEGYVASPYILNKPDFFIMNSIFGNQDSKETIITTKCRIALLNYFKEKQYIGKIDEQMRIDAGISTSPNSTNQWQVFTKPKDAKPNSVFFKRLYNKSSQFTDFAVIITNSVSGERKLLYFYFDEDETPHLLTEQDAPSQGYIVDITYKYDFYSASKVLNVEYSY
ncbi:zinc ribbon domain-containing protein [Prevotella sp. P5-50]|uniref:zinc ribbon domain-containing protein n=1 Tax=Prevotella sp. P5-50 TaxID=2024217 RepID=UPI000B96699B|nr:zinc ribbon domain-containing protein [Prevotella sp. P5-50]OYP41565.1 hypothetical protein CIK88_04055 [Prevotella sp. P5-50]